MIKDLLTRFPAVGLLGPRQVGKTTLALSLASELKASSIYLDLELPSDRAKLSDPELYLGQHEEDLVILDEIHRLPGIFTTLRSLIDKRRRKGNRGGQFLLLGSASIDLLQQSAETLAGRIQYQELRPFSEPEIAGVGPGAADQLWVRGGFPDSFLAENDDVPGRTVTERTAASPIAARFATRSSSLDKRQAGQDRRRSQDFVERNSPLRKRGGPGLPASPFSPFGETGKPDGGRLAGRVLACL